MLDDKTKVISDYNYNGDKKKGGFSYYYRNSVCFLYILVVGLFVLNFFTVTRLNALENEIDFLKHTLSSIKMFDDNLIKDMIGFEDEEDIETYDSDQDPKITLSADWNLAEYDYDIYDQNNENDTKFKKNISIPIKKLEGINNYDLDSVESELNTNETESLRAKRNIVAATNDGVIINSESYAEKRARNLSSRYTLKGGSVQQYPAKTSTLGSPWPVYPYPYSSTPVYNNAAKNNSGRTKSPSVLSRRSRVKHHEDSNKPIRRVVPFSNLKSMGSYLDSDEDTTTTPDITIVRDTGFNRRRRLLKPLACAHFNGDTSSYVYGQHSNYLGNGHLRHPQSRFIDWKASDWVQPLGMNAHFSLNNGYLTVKDSGLYFVYSQVYYLDEHDTTGYKVLKNDKTILQCTLTIHSVERRLKGNTCYTAAVEYFSTNDKLSIEDITEGMLSKFEVGKSFFGLVKLGDARA